MPDEPLLALNRRLQEFGPVAVDSLLIRLHHPESKVAEAAGLQLALFPSLEPRYFPALIRADRRGKAWIARAIAGVGTEAALNYLLERARKSPDFSADQSLHMALARFGDRLRPFALAELEACRASGSMARCHGILRTLDWYPGGYPDWAVEPVAALARAPTVPHSVQSRASSFVIRRRHPVGLEVLRDQLEARTGNPHWDAGTASEALRFLDRYGPMASHLAPVVAAYLDPANGDLQPHSALTLGRIEARSEVPKLIALGARFEDDWLLAYNVVEALGRMRVAEARPLLERTARSHWHRAVRNNSWRALNSLDGGLFERPNRVGEDGKPDVTFKTEDGEDYLRVAGQRYASDDRPPVFCEEIRAMASQTIAQDPPTKVRWPGRGSEHLTFEPLSASTDKALRPRLPGARGDAVIRFRVPLRSGVLTGYDQGKKGGAVVHLRSDGSSETLFTGNPLGALWMGRFLYVLEGLPDRGVSRGTLLVIAGDPPRVPRRIRLPGVPERVLATDRRILAIDAERGDITIRRDGRLIDPESPAACTKGQ
jgi:hypothetical protein